MFMLAIILSSLLVMFASLVGVFSVWKQAGALIARNLSFLVSFSAGVFLVIAGHLAYEVFEHAPEFGDGLFWILLGAVGLLILFKILPSFHHHHDEHEEPHLHSHVDARNILASDALHNIGDGLLLVASFAVSVPLGLITTFSVFIHELVQEVSEFFVLKQAGYTTKQALFWNFMSSSTILIGAVGGYFLLDSFEALEVPLLGLSAGAFLVVVLHDLIPHSIRTSEHRVHYLKHLGWFVLGFIIMLVVNMIMPHS